MAKDTNNFSGRRLSSSSQNTKPYDANNSFVKKVATKVTDFIPQPSWISKWFNTSQDDCGILNSMESCEDTTFDEEVQKPPPPKRPCIRMDVTHPPGTFAIRPRSKSSLNQTSSSKKQYSACNKTSEDNLDSVTPLQSDVNHLESSSPALQTDRRSMSRRSELNSLISKLEQNNGAAHGIDDNSESSESTSGCSSLIPQINRQEAPSNITYNSTFTNRKRFIDDKLNFTNHLQLPRSLFTDSTSRDSLSSHRPNFNASIMTNIQDRGSPLSSPFYNGNVTFGGANMAGLYKRSRTFCHSNEPQLKVPRGANVQVKPSNTTETDSSGMSQTAKRILEALEHFSSPISDAKKIPLQNTKNMSVSSFTTRKRLREEAKTPSPRVGLRHLTRELNVPTVPDILKLRRRQKLQDTTVAARKIISANSTPPTLGSQEYHLGSENSENSKYHGKLKTKSKILVDEEEIVEEVHLPNVALPISSLPVFNFTFPEYKKSVENSSSDQKDSFRFASPIKIINTETNLKPMNNFKFRDPIIAKNKLATSESNETLAITKSLSMESSASALSIASSMMQPNFMWSESSTSPRLKEKKFSKDSKSFDTKANQIQSGSVVDFLRNFNKDVDKELNYKNCKNSNERIEIRDMEMDDWECPECFIKNMKPNMLCIACRASKCSSIDNNKKNNNVDNEATISNSLNRPKQVTNDCFGSQFKLSNHQWECKYCQAKNKQTDIKCTTCDESKTTEKKSQLPSITISNPQSSNSSIIDTFKPAEGSWECPGCMLRNATNVISCPCCGTSKPSEFKVNPKINTNVDADSSLKKKCTEKTNVVSDSSLTPATNTDLMDRFKPNQSSWECPSCMVRNDDSKNMCPCCNTAKSGSASSIDSGQTTKSEVPSLGFGDKFKNPVGSWICDSCMVQNEAKVVECVACTALKPGAEKPKSNEKTNTSNLPFSFGIPPPNTTNSSFQFGINKTETSTANSNTNLTSGFIFESNESSSQETAGQFSFGIPQNEKKTDGNEKFDENKKVEVNALSKVKETPKVDLQFTASNSDNQNEADKTDEKKTTSIFTFGTPKTQTPTETSTLLTPSFTFGTQKTKQNPSEADKDTLIESKLISLIVPTSNLNTPVTTQSFSVNLPPSLPKNSISEAKTVPTFSFGASTASMTSSNGDMCKNLTPTSLPTQSQPSFTFTKVQPVSQTASGSAFGSITTSTPAATFSFGKKSVDRSSPAKKQTTSFGSTMPPSLFSGVSNTTAAPIFSNTDAGKSTQPTFGASENKASSFITPEIKVSSFRSTGTNKTSVFGTLEPKVPTFTSPEKGASIFNTSSQTSIINPTASATFGTASSVSSPLFGSIPAPAFGNNSSPFNTGPTTQQNMFSTTKTNETNAPNPTLFTFGTASTQAPAVPQQPTSGFSFAANNSSNSTQKPLFPFSGIVNTPPTGNVFGGGAFNTPPTPSSSNFTFNAPPKPEQPMFGATVPTAAVFGTAQVPPANQSTSTFSSTSAANTGFSFGNNAQPSTSGGFKFGTMTPASTPTTGFNFNTSNSGSTVTFDPNTRPSFNFTGGSAPTTFNATPQQPVEPRKIKKAVRRMRDGQR